MNTESITIAEEGTVNPIIDVNKILQENIRPRLFKKPYIKINNRKLTKGRQHSDNKIQSIPVKNKEGVLLGYKYIKHL